MRRLRTALTTLTSPLTAALIVAFGLVLQVAGLYQSGLIQSIPQVRTFLGQPAWERGARVVEGDDFADYVRFVRDHTMDTSSVVLPPHSVISPFADVGLMQFYFFPRKVYNCGANEIEACMYRARTEHTYVLGLPHFPPPEEVLKYKEFVPFNGTFGLYVPTGAGAEAGGG